MATTAFIALGSNLGDRENYLEQAIQAMRDHPNLTVNQVSAIYETEPLGGPPGQNDFLNAVVEVQTELPASQLMKDLLEIEKMLGRVRAERNAPRTIDLDVLLYGEEVIQESELKVPHPRLHLRSFVLEPLAEIAPGAVHPHVGSKHWQIVG